jgi:hypothetical protein
MRGIKVFDAEYTVVTGHNTIQAPVSDLPRGLYIIRLQTNDTAVSQKIILK